MRNRREESFEDLIFKNRNRDYGAFDLRRRYIRSLLIAFPVAVAIIAGVLTYPVLSAFTLEEEVKEVATNVRVQVINIPKDEPPPPPPPPPEVREERVAKKARFVAPKVVQEFIEPEVPVQEEIIASPPRDTSSLAYFEDVEFQEEEEVVGSGPADDIPFTIVEEQPKFPGGPEARMKFLAENIKYPEVARESNIQGNVFVTFVIERDGSISDVRVVRGIGGGCDEEAVRVVKSMPKWLPGKQRGVPVRVQFNLPIRFDLKEG